MKYYIAKAATTDYICYSAPVGVRSIAINPSVCLSEHEHISGTAGPISMKFCMQIPFGCCSILFRQCCATLCTSSFLDDDTFGRNGSDAEMRRLHRAAMNDAVIPGRSLMSMNARYILHFSICLQQYLLYAKGTM